jgi:(p)ppGpp synthase/HD superfamily hydrolase
MVGLYRQNYITFEQVGLVLTVNLHSTERRRSGERYLDHPMAVAEGYLDIAPHYLGSDAWQMVSGTVSALMHDTGEGSNYIPKDDYAPLMPEDVVGCICRLHKKPESPYFKYIQVTGRDIRTALVKLCDLFHNCSDAKETGPSFKQKYVYPIAAAYLQACLSDSDFGKRSDS